MNLLYFYRNKTDLFIKHVLLFTVLLFATKSNAQCSDHWYIDTQTKLNSFTGCTHIPISITITGTVYNLSPLSNVVSIGGDLNISHAHSLHNLDALSSLTSIGGNIAIYGNNSLTNVNGLGNITSSNILTMQILENPNLTSIAGLGNLNTNSINYLQISGNPLLTECDIASVCTHLPRNWNTYINNNGIGCESIQAVASSCAPCQPPINFSATNKTSRTASINWTGFPGGNIYNIEYGAAGFTPGTGTQVNNFAGTSYTVTGLSELTTYDIYVKRVNLSCEWGFSQKYTFTTIAECPPAGETLVMTNQQEINNFESTYPFCVNMPGSIQIYEFMGSQITSLAALSNLESINGSFSLSRTSILNLNDLVNLERIGGDLYINNNSVLANVDGLSSLTSVGMQNSLYNRVAFTDNPLLQNLNGLSALTTVGGALDISNNHILNSLSGLFSTCMAIPPK
ncbi:MAG: hypothetical protein EOO43_14490 [Flavobacterium sp.]|nr:MAG: hypothetical protein EOO43_14490 [Flavobacterium sp.]